MSTSMTMYDYEPPKLGVLMIFFLAIFSCGTHFKSELWWNGWR